MSKKLFFSLILILAALAERLFFDLGPNVELVTTATILGSIYLGREYGITIPLIILAFSDIFLGNTKIMLFTWSAFAQEGLFIWWLARRINFKKKKIFSRIFSISGFGAGASLWFYLWTNFGVWFLDSWGMYPRTFFGLVTCYIAGLPFLKINLVSNIIFVPLGVLIIEILRWVRNFNFRESFASRSIYTSKV